MPSTVPDFVTPMGDGVFTIDTGFQRPRFDAAYLVVERGRAAFVDTGTQHAVPRLLAALESQGLSPAEVDYVIPTHVHLDHAGGVGQLMLALPTARLLVHPRGARHMIDPQALYQGALALYGQEEMDRSYGALVAVPPARVTTTDDGMVVELGGRPLRFIDTPGHARHHHCIWDEASRGWFCGDTFGLSYREFDTARGAWAFPASTPVQFEPEALKRSMERLLGTDPRAMYLTHFGGVGDAQRLAGLLAGQIDAMAALGLRHRHRDDRQSALKRELRDLYAQQLREHGVPGNDAVDLIAPDIDLNAKGIEAWLDRENR